MDKIVITDHEHPMRCDCQLLKTLLLNQWHAISRKELELTHYLQSRIAQLIERKYGVRSQIMEAYLENIERRLTANN